MQTITQTQIEIYKEYLISEEKSEVTVEKYIRDISAFSRWLDCGELNKTAVLHYKQQLVETMHQRPSILFWHHLTDSLNSMKDMT